MNSVCLYQTCSKMQDSLSKPFFMSHFLALWDAGSKSARKTLLIKFLASISSNHTPFKQSVDLFLGHVDHASLFFTRLLAHAKACYASISIAMHLRGILVFLRSENAMMFMLEFLGSGGLFLVECAGDLTCEEDMEELFEILIELARKSANFCEAVLDAGAMSAIGNGLERWDSISMIRACGKCFFSLLNVFAIFVLFFQLERSCAGLFNFLSSFDKKDKSSSSS